MTSTAAAGVLGVTLGGPTSYPSHTEHRPILGSGRAPQPAEILRANRLSRLIQYAALTVLVTAILLREATGRTNPGKDA